MKYLPQVAHLQRPRHFAKPLLSRRSDGRPGLPRAGALARRQVHRLPLERKLPQGPGLHRPLARRCEDGQAHRAPGEEHLRSELSGDRASVFAELVLAGRQAARIHRARRRTGKSLSARRAAAKAHREVSSCRSTESSNPSWSPDGKRLVFSGNKGGITDLYHDRCGREESDAAHARPVRRHAAAVVARRIDDRVRDRSGSRRGSQESALPALADRDLSHGRRKHRADSRIRQGSTSIRCGRPIRSRSRSSPIARAGRTSSSTISRRSSTTSSRTWSAA